MHRTQGQGQGQTEQRQTRQTEQTTGEKSNLREQRMALREDVTWGTGLNSNAGKLQPAWAAPRQDNVDHLFYTDAHNNKKNRRVLRSDNIPQIDKCFEANLPKHSATLKLWEIIKKTPDGLYKPLPTDTSEDVDQLRTIIESKEAGEKFNPPVVHQLSITQVVDDNQNKRFVAIGLGFNDGETYRAPKKEEIDQALRILSTSIPGIRAIPGRKVKDSYSLLIPLDDFNNLLSPNSDISQSFKSAIAATASSIFNPLSFPTPYSGIPVSSSSSSSSSSSPSSRDFSSVALQSIPLR